ncbi:sigma factor [Streptomyces silaceus]|uniref:sigma factor n=1 Tax=Streptomyces silaceus TaxID=545123 RepID=UPI0006EBAAFE|nr:sigma factor [Streptomyces silaceus]
MTDVPSDVPTGISAVPAGGAPAGAAEPAAAPVRVPVTADYTRVFEEQQSRLVAYARSLTGNAWVADDLVAEAHFRVWRRLSAGHEIENVPAYLMTTVRHLAATVGRGAAGRETPLDPQAPETVWVTGAGDSPFGAGGEEADPAARVSSVDLLTRVLGQLPERWVKALWLAEAEGQPLDAVGRRIGAGRGATAVLLHRAREGMRQAFLRAHPGAPEDPACEGHWDRMPAHIRGEASTRQSETLLAHLNDCADCRARLAVLMRANDRLPAFVGPALLVFVLGGSGTFLLPLAAGSAVGAGAAAAGSGSQGGGLLHGVKYGLKHALTGGGKVSVAAAGAIGVTVAGAAVAAGLALGGSGQSAAAPEPRAATAESGVPQPPVPPWRAAPGTGDAQDAGGSGDSRGTGGSGDAGDRVAPPVSPARPASPSAPGGAAGQAPDQPRPVPPQTPTDATPPAPGGAASPTPERPTAPPASPTPTDPGTPTPTPPPSPTPTPIDPTPVDPTPVDPTPVDPTPVEPTPVDPTPVEPTPTDPPTEPSTQPTPDPEPPVCEPWIGPIHICHWP